MLAPEPGAKGFGFWCWSAFFLFRGNGGSLLGARGIWFAFCSHKIEVELSGLPSTDRAEAGAKVGWLPAFFASFRVCRILWGTISFNECKTRTCPTSPAEPAVLPQNRIFLIFQHSSYRFQHGLSYEYPESIAKHTVLTYSENIWSNESFDMSFVPNIIFDVEICPF